MSQVVANELRSANEYISLGVHMVQNSVLLQLYVMYMYALCSRFVGVGGAAC